MPFQPSDPAILKSLHPGDEVEGTLRVVKEDGAVKEYQLLDLKVTKPAEPPTHVIDVSKGKVQIRQQPRRLELGDPVPDFTMTGQDGNALKLSDLRGKVVVLTFIYTRCPMPDFCPLMDRKFSDLAQHVAVFPNKAKDIRLISLSFDPEHDTPEILRKHAQVRGAIPPLWTYAVASHPELAKIAAPLGLFFSPDGGDIAHNLCTAVIDPRGNLARLEVGTQAESVGDRRFPQDHRLPPSRRQAMSRPAADARLFAVRLISAYSCGVSARASGRDTSPQNGLGRTSVTNQSRIKLVGYR